MRRQFLRANWHQWRSNYRRRLLELVFWRKHKNAWRSGYGNQDPGIIEYGFEALVRILELLGFGLILLFCEALFAGKRYRLLSAQESAFAKTYFTNTELSSVFLDERAKWIAKPMGIAFVAGFAIKTYGLYSRKLLVHELVHVRQFRRWGWAYAAKALMAQWTGAGYDVPRQWAFAKTRDDKLKRVATFHPALNAEQEARRLEEWV